MNPIRHAAALIQLPAHLAAAAAGTAAGLASAGLRTTVRVAGWAVERATGSSPSPADTWVRDAPPVVVPDPPTPADEVPATPERASGEEAPATEAPAKRVAAKRAPAERAPAEKAPAKKTSAKKAAARKAPSKKAAVVAPALGLSEAEAEDVLLTPSGIPAAGDGVNPDTTETDLHQPGTEPLMDPATTKAVASESDVLRRAADPDKG